MKYLFVTLALTFSLSSFANDCENADSNYEMRECAAKELEKQDAELNRQYGLVMKKLDKEGIEKLKKAQRAWISFRDAQCELEADEMRGGTGAALIMLGCLGRMTEERADDLQDIVDFR